MSTFIYGLKKAEWGIASLLVHSDWSNKTRNMFGSMISYSNEEGIE